MNVRRRQVLIDLANANGAINLQAGTMQAMFGPVEAASGVDGGSAASARSSRSNSATAEV